MFLSLVVLLLIKNSSSLEDLKKYAYVVGIGYYLQDKNEMIDVTNTCSGALVRTTWVLTAGDCVTVDKRYYVIFNSYNNKSELIVNKTAAIERFLHPGYNRPTYTTNIGLMRIAEVAVPILPILSMKDYSTSFELPVINISYMKRADGIKNNSLRINDLVLTSCDATINPMLCALNSTVVTIGDKTGNAMLNDWFNFGGSLLHNDTIIGLYVGKRNAYVARFVSITEHYYWIDQIITENTVIVQLNLELQSKKL